MSFEFLNAIKREIINIDKEDDYDEEDVDTYENEFKVEERVLSIEPSEALINFFSRINYLRNETEDNIIKLFTKAYFDSPINTLKILFYIRDKYKGRGEKRVFRVILKHLGEENDYYLRKRLNLISVYGRWDDLYSLFDTALQDDVINLIKDQLQMDKDARNPSTLAKWLKSENTSSKKSKQLAKKTRTSLELTSREYRILLSSLRSKLNLVEHKITNKDYTDLEYGDMPSGARRKYYKAFSKNDEKRYTECISLIKKLYKNDKSTQSKYLTRGITLNEAIFPYDILDGLISNTEDYSSSIYSNLWSCLPNYINKNAKDSLVVLGINQNLEERNFSRDVALGGVSTALYLREKNKGIFKNHIISMKEPSNFKKILGNNLKERFEGIYEGSLCNNINVESSLDLVLFAGIKNNLSNDDMPGRIFYIVGNGCKVSLISEEGKENTNFLVNSEEFERIKEKWQSANYKIPQLIFWMIESHSEYNLILKDDNNISYAFGYNSEIFLNLIRGDFISTVTLLKDTLTSERYKALE